MAKKTVSAAVIAKLKYKALREIEVARLHKQKKVKFWQMNEDMYYMKKVQRDETRANVDTGLMQGYIHTFLSKIDAPLTFKFKKRKQSDLKAVNKINSLKEQDSNDNDWVMKDLAGKKQVALYGRAIYAYYANSVDGVYEPNLEKYVIITPLLDK